MKSTRNKFVQPFPAADVTTIDASEKNASAGGLESRHIDAIWDAVVRCYNTGIHPALTICIRRGGEIVLHRSIGHVRGNEPGADELAERVVARPDSLFSLYSASKAVAAICLHHANEHGLVHLDDPVSTYLPEFRTNDKKFITLKQILTHKAGVPKIPQGAADLDNLHIDGALRTIMAEADVQWPAGRQVGYHALTGGFIIGEIIREVSGLDIRQYWTRHFRKPMAMKNFDFGVPASKVDHVAPNVYTGPPLPDAFERVAKRVLGVTYRNAIRLSNDPRFMTAIIPAGNVIGTAEELSRFYEMLLNGGSYRGQQMLLPETVRRATLAKTHMEVDRMLGFPVRYSMGFMLGRSRFSMYFGDTGQVFGHIGMVNIVGYADPARDISVGIMNNGKPGLTARHLSFWKILGAISSQIPKIADSDRRETFASIDQAA